MTFSIKTWSDLTQLSATSTIQWAQTQPWAIEMTNCMQDPEWHAEGDVWTHTMMVCDELMKLQAWPRLTKTDQTKLLLTAILHDSAKPQRTVVEEGSGRIRSPKHAQYGARIARQLLMRLGCEPETREEICRLILFHGRPPHLEKQRSPQRELIKLSWHVQHQLLYLFAIADTRGRVCEQGYSEETLELWKLIALENDCLTQPYPFPNDHARFLFYRGLLDNLQYEPHEDYRCKMTIMVGLPGSGKDTWLAENRNELPIVSLDEIRQRMKILPTANQGQVIQAAREQCREHLRNRRDFALNATNTTRQVRKLWIDVGAEYNARIELVYVEPSFESLFEQNQSRRAQVPRAVIERLIDKMDPPTLTESHDLVWATF